MRGGDLFKQLTKVEQFSEREAVVLSRQARPHMPPCPAPPGSVHEPPEPHIGFHTSQIVSATAYLHEHGVVHCDLKPSNILLKEP